MKTRMGIILSVLFVLLMSLPWLLPYMGWTALVGLLPLLLLERLATEHGQKRFGWWAYGLFVLWNAVTTWWVGMATVGGAVFAILANALQMWVIFASFRWVKKRTAGVLPYLYLAAAWIAWERFYLTSAQISWPWLVLGNAFAGSVGLVQWYSVLGTLGGSLWVWTANLSLFGIMVALSDGRMACWNAKARICAFGGVALAFLGPMLWSLCLRGFHEEGTPLRVVIGQPSLDPYQKFESLTQTQQDQRFLSLVEKADWSTPAPVLVLAPETFTSPVVAGDPAASGTYRHFQEFLQRHPQATVLFGASAYDRTIAYAPPTPLSYDQGTVDAEGHHLWVTAHNSALITDTTGRVSLFHKSKLVVGTELTPYPSVLLPIENLLGGNLMGKCVGQPEISCLPMRVPDGEIPIGTAICYESVFGEYCTGYVRKGARLLTVITNDAWWGNTPGYRQHFNYSRLRAIETRRWVARCGNTGLSAFIDPCGRVVSVTPWWEQAVLEGEVRLLDGQSFFVRYGDMVGRLSVFLFLLLAAAALFRGSARPSGNKKR